MNGYHTIIGTIWLHRPTNIYNELQKHNNHKNGFRSTFMLRPKGAKVFKLKIQAASRFNNKLSRSLPLLGRVTCSIPI